ncbi:YlbG family protein [Texcoconibacillus texcoconensis]|uniref:UPF0298 protein HNQ41_000338 n=1 Tax=Texcoconibacillus texcoconensis TaxID=1095777 RepID=A0A840QLG1_9BACI|nr:YlbG family protein [Texcoconibacillus texcoconensis]MBB5172198.1 uncharacterized protein YlbG (UPF0298 family) [Texcoconibacillus texcoconensis]
MIGDRVGIAVWIKSLKQVKQLRRFGNIHYVSRRMKYVILYCEQDEVETTMEKISSLHFVKEVQMSMRPWVNTEYQDAKPDKAKEYDYKMGI